MPTRKQFYFVLPCLFYVSIANSAGWEYAEFGMTAAELVKRSNGKARISDDPDLLATSQYVAGPFKFSVHFLSEDGDERLDKIKLILEDTSKYEGLKNVLSQKYGDPSCSESTENQFLQIVKFYKTCLWFTKSTAISLTHEDSNYASWDPETYLVYSPLALDKF